MSDDQESLGVKRAHNGVIGESRTKAFLIDRFWILERSVDIEGADFIIQRKLEGQSILDNKPARFGIVQSKFSQDEHTQHLLKKEYVINKDENPNQEFFLLVNIGYEDSQKICLLSAKDIVENFKLNTEGFYRISTSCLIPKFLVINKSSSLDYIENSIKCAEFYKNRFYVFSEINSLEPNFDAIQPEYKRDIDYADGGIPDLFKEQKLMAYKTILEIEKIHAHLLKFVLQTDPIEASLTAELFNHYYSDKIRLPWIFDTDLYHKAKRFTDQIKSLRDDNILERYLSLKEIIRNKVNNFLSSLNRNLDLTSSHIITIKYNSIDLSEFTVKNEIISTVGGDNKEYFTYLEQVSGKIKISINLRRHLKNNNSYSTFNEYLLIDIMDKIYQLKYFETNNEPQ